MKPARVLSIALVTCLLSAPAGAEDLSLAGSTAPGENVDLTFRGTPGQPVLLFVSAGFSPTPIPVPGGDFWLDLSSIWFMIPLGSMPGPELSIGAQIPPNPAFVGAAIHLQAGAPEVTNPVSMVIRNPDKVVAGVGAGDRLGAMVLPADFDGDGTLDFFVSAEGANGAGRVDMFSGAAATFVQSANDPTPEAGAKFGNALAVGDVNGDGNLDLIVGAPFAAAASGEVWILHGPTFANQTHLPAAVFGGGFGTALAVGDFDQNGLVDVAVGAPGETVGGLPIAGRVRIYSGPPLIPLTTLVDPTPAGPALFGGAMHAGDGNGDGFDDLLIGAPTHAVGGIAGAGEAWRFDGPFTGAPTQYVDPQPTTNGAFGCRVKFGDVTGGPALDVLIGTPGGFGNVAINPGGLRVGEVQIYPDGNPAAVFELFDPTFEDFQHFGMDVSAADVNGDGKGDLIVGAFLGDRPGIPDAGQVFVYLGPELRQTFFVTPAISTAGAQFGVFGDAADLDGDGRAELIIGAPFDDSGAFVDAGTVTVVDLF